MYQPMTCTALSHNTVCWDLRPGGAKDPGKDQPGNWYHDHNQPWVDLGGRTPTLHYEVSFDPTSMKNIVEIRGRTTFASEAPEAALVTIEPALWCVFGSGSCAQRKWFRKENRPPLSRR